MKINSIIVIAAFVFRSIPIVAQEDTLPGKNFIIQNLLMDNIGIIKTIVNVNLEIEPKDKRDSAIKGETENRLKNLIVGGLESSFYEHEIDSQKVQNLNLDSVGMFLLQNDLKVKTEVFFFYYYSSDSSNRYDIRTWFRYKKGPAILIGRDFQFSDNTLNKMKLFGQKYVLISFADIRVSSKNRYKNKLFASFLGGYPNYNNINFYLLVLDTERNRIVYYYNSSNSINQKYFKRRADKKKTWKKISNLVLMDFIKELQSKK